MGDRLNGGKIALRHGVVHGSVGAPVAHLNLVGLWKHSAGQGCVFRWRGFAKCSGCLQLARKDRHERAVLKHHAR